MAAPMTNTRDALVTHLFDPRAGPIYLITSHTFDH
jgi:hypothetical protein